MPAPKGNDYGKKYWFNRSVAKPGEKTVRISTRLSEGEVEAIKERLQPGETVCSWLRERAREALVNDSESA